MKIHNHMTVVLAVVLAALNAVAANFPVGTHLVKGTLKDWQNNVLTSSAAVTIQAVATNGTVLASTPVDNPSADGYNFLLQIPLSSTATDSTAAVGDTMNCVLVQDSGLSLAVDPITVGDDVWIGGMVCVMPGVTIGSGSVIGAGSVVINDIPEGVLAAGNPCRVIRKLTPQDRDRYIR